MSICASGSPQRGQHCTRERLVQGGLTANKFGPDDAHARAMLVQVLYRAERQQGRFHAQFTDVADGGKCTQKPSRQALRNSIVRRLHQAADSSRIRFVDHPSAAGDHPVPLIPMLTVATPQGSAALIGYADAASVESVGALKHGKLEQNGNGRLA